MRSDSSREHGNDLRESIRALVLEQGFHRVGFAAAGRAPGAARLRRWVADGFAGRLHYMERTLEKRMDPRLVLEGTRTIVAVALHHDAPAGGPSAPAGAGAGRANIARYARGTDYHRVLERRLRAARGRLREAFPQGAYRYYVDTGPVLERDWARMAGIGWVGKNTCAIDPVRGSYFVIGIILSTLEVPPDLPSENHCGTCRRCIDACPTGALTAPYRLDARRCIAYLNTELRGRVPRREAEHAGNLVFGCDICQEVCPYNRRGHQVGDPELAPRPENVEPRLEDLASLDAAAFRQRFQRSPVLRARFQGFLRNVIHALGNEGTSAALEVLSALATRNDVSSDAVLSEALRGALRRTGDHGAAGCAPG